MGREGDGCTHILPRKKLTRSFSLKFPLLSQISFVFIDIPGSALFQKVKCFVFYNIPARSVTFKVTTAMVAKGGQRHLVVSGGSLGESFVTSHAPGRTAQHHRLAYNVQHSLSRLLFEPALCSIIGAVLNYKG